MKNHTPVGKVLLAAAKVKEPASVGKKISTAVLRMLSGHGCTDECTECEAIARAFDRLLARERRKAAWESYDLGCNVKELVAQDRFPCSEMERKYGPRPRSKR